MSHGKVKIFPIDEVPQSIIDQITRDRQNLSVPVEYRSLYDEQLVYITQKAKNSFFVAAYEGDIYIGGVGLFLTDCYAVPSDLEPPIIQGIAKSVISSPIKINSLLIPAVIDFLRDRGYNQVSAAPYERQASILRRHYHFEMIDGYEDLLICHF